MTFRRRTAIVVGDSCAAGAGATEKFGWAQQLERSFYAESTNPLGTDCFYNLAVPGETAESALRAIESGEVSRRHRFPTLSILSLGGQQAVEDIRQTGEPQLEQFAAYMGEIATRLFACGNILQVGIVAPNTHRIKGFSRALDDFSAREIEGILLDYERCAQKAARDACPTERAVASVALFEASRSAFVMDSTREGARAGGVDAYTTAGDGVHPDDMGHEFVLRRVQPDFSSMMESTMALAEHQQ